jgi:hypothetical protein
MAALTFKEAAAQAERERARRELLKWIVKNEALRHEQRKANEK